MRMARALSTLLAVLCGAVAGAGDVMANVSRVHRAAPPHHPHRVLYVDRTDEEEATAAWKRSHWREMKSILQHEGANVEKVECCPSVLEMVEKKGGKNLRGRYVHLYRDGENKQLLYELSCAPGVVDKPCRFVDARLYNQSVCVQQYSYTYALVRDSADTEMPQYRNRTEKYFNVTGTGGWSMDHIKVRAGCECQITPPKRKNAHRRRPERQRHKRKNKKFEEDDDT